MSRGVADEQRAARIEGVLACPRCRAPLPFDLACTSCSMKGARRGAQIDMGGFSSSELENDPLNRLKEAAKQKLGPLYPKAIEVLSPVHTTGFVKPFLRTFDLDRDLVADLGCGTHRHDPRVVCVDGGSYSNVDIVADLRHLPLRDGVLAGILSVAVLEHVVDPAAHVAEMRRVLAPGGRLLCYVPFMQPFHASPHDYQRYTRGGLEVLFRDFEVLGIRVGAGPTSGMLWVVQEWLALALSFGNERLYRAILPLTWALSPLKLFDVVLARHPAAGVIASGFVIEARAR